MALYTEACTVVRTDAGLSESFELKVGLHQGSVLSPSTSRFELRNKISPKCDNIYIQQVI